MRLEGPVAQAQEWGILKKGGGRGKLHPYLCRGKADQKAQSFSLTRMTYSNPNLGTLTALQLPQRAIPRRRGRHSLLRRM